MSKINQFTAKFNQQVYSDDGNALHKSSGVISVSKPNLVNWHTILPEETQIISDGETLWFFDPFIEQVTAYSLDSSIQNTPILLLSSNDEQLWQQFDIVQNDLNTFEIIALDQNSQVKSLSLVLSVSDNEKETKIEKFVIVDASGQRSEIKLSHFEQSNNISKDTYKFELPDGVYLDDQR